MAIRKFPILRSSFTQTPLTLRKQIILLAAITFAAVSTFSQPISSKSSIAFSAGPSIPMGDYSNTGKQNNHADFSKAGINASISYRYKLDKTIGLEAMVYGQKNALNTSAIEKNLSETGFLNHQPGYYSNWSVEKKNWQIGSFMAGVSGETAPGNSSQLSLNGKILFGIALVKSPDLKADSRSENDYAVFSGKYGSGAAPSWLISPGVNYKLSRRFNLILNAAYFGTTKISFQDATEVIAATNGGLIVPGYYDLKNSMNSPAIYGEQGTRKQSIQSINLNLGLSFHW